MDDEHEDDDGIDAARSGCRNEDSGDGTRGIQVADSGEIGHGTPDGGVEQGRSDSSRVDGTGEGVQQVALQWRSAPLPTVDEFAGYERIQPGAADRIITMAEKSLDAEIEAQRTSNEVAAKDHKAQNICMISPLLPIRSSRSSDSEARLSAPRSDNRWRPLSARSSEPSRSDRK